MEHLEPLLRGVGLTVSAHVPSSGEPVYTVKGITHPHRQLLRELGGQWDAIKRAWVFAGSDPRQGIVSRLREEARAKGFSDIASEPTLSNKPQYWGHRQRLRDRFLSSPEDSLPDYELLELLLFFSIPRIDTKPLAKDLISRFGSLAGIVNADPDRLAEFENMNHHTITLFKAMRVLAARLVREEVSERPVLDNWNKLVAYLRATMAHCTVEQFRVLFLDRMNVLIADEVQHRGTIDHTPVYPREVVKRALAVDASALVIVHNHPSNHPKPSSADIEMTRQVREALDKVGIVLHDHLIISKRGHTSFRQMGLMTPPS
jgi:DNA repair protein RadC